jgi:hypothetical protein
LKNALRLKVKAAAWKPFALRFEAQSKGCSLETIRFEVLPELVKPLLASPDVFLRWVKEDSQFSFFYFEVQESGVCAKPSEAAAMILEAIVVEALEDSNHRFNLL